MNDKLNGAFECVKGIAGDLLPGYVKPDNVTPAKVRDAKEFNHACHQEHRADMIVAAACFTVIILGVKYVLPAVVDGACKILDKLRDVEDVEIIEEGEETNNA